MASQPSAEHRKRNALALPHDRAAAWRCDDMKRIATYAAAVPSQPDPSRRTDAAAALLSSATYRDLAAHRPLDALDRLTRVIASAAPSATATLADAFDDAYAYLVRNYRNEYVFKNVIVSNIVFGHHRPSTASAILELPLGNSFADVAIFNGTSTVYEIKTDLDSFARLPSQVADYATRVEHVNLVVSDRRAASVERHLPDRVGLITLGKRGSLRTLRPAESNRDRMRSDHIFGSLREAEATRIVLSQGILLDSSDAVESWHQLQAAFSALDVDVAHAGAVAAFRQRGAKIVDIATDPALPKSARALAYAVPLSNAAKARLRERLSMPVSLLRGA